MRFDARSRFSVLLRRLGRTPRSVQAPVPEVPVVERAVASEVELRRAVLAAIEVDVLERVEDGELVPLAAGRLRRTAARQGVGQDRLVA